jgi:S1-C subfamily serine protease
MTCWLGLLLSCCAGDFPAEVEAAARAVTVRVANLSRNLDGSGTLVGQGKGGIYVLTAAHLAEDDDRLEISTFNDASYPKPAAVYRNVTVVAREPDADLALLRLDTADRPTAVVGRCPPAEVPRGRFTGLTVGCTGGRAPSCLPDAISGKRHVRRPGAAAAWFWEAETPQAVGRSGGPLLDGRGRLLGVCSGRSDGKGYYAHLDELQRFLKRHGLDGSDRAGGGEGGIRK